MDLIARNARGREIGVDLTITNHLNDGLRNYRRTESYGGMANTEAESRKNRLRPGPNVPSVAMLVPK